MPRRKPHTFGYAQLPVFKYQTFDREALTFSNAPIVPSGSGSFWSFGQDTDIGVPKHEDLPKEPVPEVMNIAPSEQEAELETVLEPADTAVEAPPASGMFPTLALDWNERLASRLVEGFTDIR